MDCLRSLLGIRRMYTVSNAWIREMFGVTKEVNEMIVLRCCGHVKRMGNDRPAIIYKGICGRVCG